MNEKEMRTLVRDCLNQYHKEDKKILLDISVLQITCITYFLYNLIFFGNKIILSKETLMLIQKKNISEKERYTEK